MQLSVAKLVTRGGKDAGIRCLAAAPATEVETIDPLAGTVWDQLVSAYPEANCFHSSAWARVLHQTYGHRPFYLRFHRAGQTTALLPFMEVRSRITGNRGINLPFSDSSPALISGDADRERIMETVTMLARDRGWNYCEFRGGKPPMSDVSPSVTFHRHWLDLSEGADSLKARFSNSVRRAIRKADKSGITVEITSSSSEKAVRDYYRLHTRTRQRHGAPPQSLSFFLGVQQEMLSSGEGAIVLARSNGRLAAGAVFFRFGKNALYKFGASDERLQNLRANNLVMWEAIRFFTRAGCALLDLGRTSLHNHGLRHFKLGWAAIEEKLDYFAWNPAAAKWVTRTDHSQSFVSKIFRRLPTSLNRLAGTLLYPHLD